MAKILISIPDELAMRMRAVIPNRQRSGVIAGLLETEVTRLELGLFDAAKAVEKDKKLNADMADWDITSGDGVDEAR